MVAVEKVDLRDKCPPVYDQGNLGSCTACAIGGLIHYVEQNEPDPDVCAQSRLFIYYNERMLENTIDSDAGAELRNGIKAVVKYGSCCEDLWPYDISKFAVSAPNEVYRIAQDRVILDYYRVRQTLADINNCLAGGFPIAFGITIYESFESDEVARTGHVPLPRLEEHDLGGHAIMLVGFDDTRNKYICRNSWSKDWGMDGYFELPYSYVLDSNLAADFWTIRKVK
jgi:C1A family cysteine protease